MMAIRLPFRLDGAPLDPVSFLDEPAGRAGPADRDRGADRPRRSGDGRRPPRGRRPYGPGTDQRSILIRRTIAFLVALVAIVLVVLLIRGCLAAREERGYEDYAQEATSLVSESSQESEALFELLDDPGEQGAVDVQNSVNGLSVDAQRLVERAQATDPPAELRPAHANLLLTLELRRSNLEGIARELPTALGDEQRDEAVAKIARDMRGFLASDVIFKQRAAPNLTEALEAQDLAGAVEDLPESEFLPDTSWLDPTTVKRAVSRVDSGSE
jgi:hypothetical protein